MNKINIQRFAGNKEPGILASSIQGMMINGSEAKGAKLGSTQVLHFPKWRTPELADSVGGKTMKFVYPSSAPIAKYGSENQGYNNTYIVTSGPYMLREIVYYESEEAAEDYSWEIMRWSTCIELFNTNRTDASATIIYQCDVRTKMIFGDSGMTNTVLSTQEITRQTSITLPSDFGNIVSYGGTMLNVIPQVDGNDIEKRPYTLAPLTASDNIGYGLTLFAEFPTNIDKIWFPNPPSAGDYGIVELGSEYTLFSVEYEYTAPGDEYPTRIGYNYSANLYEDGETNYDTYEWEGNGTYYFSINYSEGMMGGATVCYKQYGSSTTEQWNNTVIVPSCGVSIPLGTYLNTNSKLLPYVKKILWQ